VVKTLDSPTVVLKELVLALTFDVSANIACERNRPFDVQVLAWSIGARAWREER